MSWFRPRLAAAILAAVAANVLLAAVSPEAGSFLFQTFPSKAYGANPQNWAIAQDHRGIMYFGNNDGVLEFDGINWRLISLGSEAIVRALAVDANGRVYVGARGQFGYLEADKNGVTRFVRLEVPKADSNFLDVWSVVPTPAGVYFGTDSKVFFRSNSGEIKIWRAKKRFGRIFALLGELFIPVLDEGIRRLDGDDLVAGPRTSFPVTDPRYLFIPGERPLLGTRRALFNFTLNEITPFANEANDYINEHEAFSMRQLSSGDIAIGTRSGGLVLLDRQGHLERILTRKSGLTSEWVTRIYEDRDHGIWLASNNGIVRFNPTLSTFGQAEGIHGQVLCEARFGGAMYIGTAQGVFRMRKPEQGSEPSFDEVEDLHEQVVVLSSRGEDLLAGADHGVYRIRGNKAERLAKADIGVVYDLTASARGPDVFYSAGLSGVRKWQQSGGSWKPGEPVGVKGQEFRTVVEDPDGTVWSTTRGGVWHIDFATEPARTLREFTTADGIPPSDRSLYLFRGHVVLATAKGLLRFDEKADRFVPDLELGPEYANGTKPVSLLREDRNGNVWITGNGYHDLIENEGHDQLRRFASPIVPVGAGILWSIFFDPDGVVWASDPDGVLFRQEELNLKELGKAPPAWLREVSVLGQKEPLFGGDSAIKPIQLEYRDNDLRFEFAAPFYDAPGTLLYQYRLDGNEKQWSEWTKETKKEYTNLFEGAYRFHVRVRDVHGSEGEEVVFPFRVEPPFYRRWWAYGTYVAAFLLAGWLILRWRLEALEAKNRWLEGVVEERTAEVREERDQNEALLLNILPKPVAAELRTNGSVRPTTFEDSTVCFSDFVGFTLSSEKLPAETLINALNEYFTAFDDIIGRYGLEKLKTIGDAYMFAGGLPNRRPSHAVDAVLAALEMAAVVNRLSRPEQGVNWKIRLGLYSGPVVSGVVGVRKFAFDIWGNTVNFAARMESAGKPGQVNLSETTYQRVAQFIDCEARGPVRIKEGREMEMYFAIGPKTELMQGPTVEGVPQVFRDAYEKAFGEAPKSFPAAELLDEWLQARMAVGPSEPK